MPENEQPRCFCGALAREGEFTCGNPDCLDEDDGLLLMPAPRPQVLPGFLFVSAEDEKDAADAPATSVHNFDSAPPTEREDHES